MSSIDSNCALYLRKVSLLGLLFIVVIAFGSKYLIFEKKIARADFIIVLAGDQKVRIPAALKLYKQGLADKIILTNDGVKSRWSKIQQKNLYNIEWSKIELVQAGVPAEDIYLLPYTKSGTMYDALHVREFLLKNKLSKILLVTSDYHSLRAYLTFRHVLNVEDFSIGVYPVKSDKYSGVPSFYDWITNSASELIKLCYYGFRYGLFFT